MPDESCSPGGGNEGRRKSFRTDVQHSTEENIDAVPTKDPTLLKRRFSCRIVKHDVFLWNLPDVEEVHLHYDGETSSSSSDLKF
ncbi:hypothetical protein TNCV_3335671 [Trichonephila clavipes]|nr:hypothetical protein TNCV_3335671 [Trichonephila clavipes]